MPDITANGQTFSWGEAKFSGLSRGIQMARRGQGFKNDSHKYQFKPDPHKDKDYNKPKEIGKFYEEAAMAIAGMVNGTNWPDDGTTIEINGRTYSLTIR